MALALNFLEPAALKTKRWSDSSQRCALVFVHGLLSGWDLAQCARAGNAAGAIVAARLMCADDMPYLSDIELVLDRGSVPAGI